MVNLLCAYNSNWETWQNVGFIVLLVLIGLLLLYIVGVFFVGNARMEKGSRRLEWYDKQIEIERKILESENAQNKAKLEETRKELKEKEDAIKEAEKKAELAREQLIKNEEEIRKIMTSTEMSKKELAEYQKKEGTNVSEDIAINALTDKSLSESKLLMETVNNCKVPKGKNFKFTAKDVIDYVTQKPNVTFTNAVGAKPAYFRVEKRNLAFIYMLPNDKVRVTFKCGPVYGTKLCKNFGQNVSVAKFPYGLTWFTVSNETAPCALELFQQLIDISYKVAKLGY